MRATCGLALRCSSSPIDKATPAANAASELTISVSRPTATIKVNSLRE